MLPIGKFGEAEIIELHAVVDRKAVDGIGFFRDSIDHEYYMTKSEAKAEQRRRTDSASGNSSVMWWVRSRYAVKFEDGTIYLLAHTDINDRSLRPSVPVAIVESET